MTSPTNVRISRREGFNAAHQLQDASLSEDENRRLYGKCVNLHGHKAEGRGEAFCGARGETLKRHPMGWAEQNDAPDNVARRNQPRVSRRGNRP